MVVKIIKAKDGIIRKVSDSYSVLNLLTIHDSNKVSLWISTANNHNETTKTSSDRVYYIMKGQLIIDDKLFAKKWDVVFVPENTEYNFKWSFNAILINSPAFKKENELVSRLNNS